MPEPTQWVDLLTQGGLLGAVLIALWAMYTERIVPKARVDELNSRLQQALDGWRESTDALEKNTDALDALRQSIENAAPSPVRRERTRAT